MTRGDRFDECTLDDVMTSMRAILDKTAAWREECRKPFLVRSLDELRAAAVAAGAVLVETPGKPWAAELEGVRVMVTPYAPPGILRLNFAPALTEEEKRAELLSMMPRLA